MVDASVTFDQGPGAYGIEVIADSQYGPVVLNNHLVYCETPLPALPVVRVSNVAVDKQGDDASETILRALNRHRRQHGLAPVQPHPILTRAAQSHAREMDDRKIMAHTSPNTGNLATRLRSAGIEAIAVAENLAEASSPQAAFQAFLDSPGHARNLLLVGMTHVGIGVSGRYFAMTLARLESGMTQSPSVGPSIRPK